MKLRSHFLCISFIMFLFFLHLFTALFIPFSILFSITYLLCHLSLVVFIFTIVINFFIKNYLKKKKWYFACFPEHFYREILKLWFCFLCLKVLLEPGVIQDVLAAGSHLQLLEMLSLCSHYLIQVRIITWIFFFVLLSSVQML